jgi:hypothetical protein
MGFDLFAEHQRIAYDPDKPGVALWSFFTNPKNQKTLSWLGAGIVAAGGIWAVVTYVWPAHEGAKVVCAQPGGVAAGRDASGNTVNFTGSGLISVQGSPCTDTSKPH